MNIQSNQFKYSWKMNLAVCLFGSFSTSLSMTMLLPFLPIYVADLGVKGNALITQWSGIAFSATFITAGLTAPLWGRLGNKYGRKSMLLRASLGMAICISLMGYVTNIHELVILRLIVGLAGGYTSGAIILIAIQAPKGNSGQALGLLTSGSMLGNIVGPVVGGIIPSLIGIRDTFLASGVIIFIAFIATLLFVKETPKTIEDDTEKSTQKWYEIPERGVILSMLLVGFILMIANMSIEPVITLYLQSLHPDTKNIALIAGLTISATGLGSALSSMQLGRIADHIGHPKVIVASLIIASILLIPQAFVTSSWQLVILRFLMGVTLGGLLPCIASVIRQNTPNHLVGAALGYSISAQFIGQFVGPLMGGFIGGHISIHMVFFTTSVLLFITAIYTKIKSNKSLAH